MTDATKTVALAADHAGYALKDQLRAVIEERGLAVLDLGTNGPDRVDYPDYGHAMAQAIRDGRATRGVLVCGTGIGISIAANRHRGIRAALCHDVTTARLCRQHNDANVLALGARIIGFETARDCLAVFLSTDYEGGRHGDRIAKIDVLNA
ncbi:ribose 5-phosphate isomerase B [Inquilinus sp.]|uniref:ribose 5-phosphate isomerase B n=1 Tax=Inquilinus sp. TaxID=1932117 RepID=UPI0031CF43EF